MHFFLTPSLSQPPSQPSITDNNYYTLLARFDHPVCDLGFVDSPRDTRAICTARHAARYNADACPYGERHCHFSPFRGVSSLLARSPAHYSSLMVTMLISPLPPQGFSARL